MKIELGVCRFVAIINFMTILWRAGSDQDKTKKSGCANICEKYKEFITRYKKAQRKVRRINCHDTFG